MKKGKISAMYDVISHLCLWLFVVLTPLVLSVRWFRPLFMRWWLVVAIVVMCSWPLYYASVYFHFRYLDDLVASYGENPPQELLDRWAADGGPMVFAYLFGWAFGLAYLLPWLALYGALFQARKWWKKP